MIRVTFHIDERREISCQVGDRLGYRILQMLSGEEGGRYSLAMTLEEVKMAHIQRVVDVTDSLTEAARMLGISYRTLMVKGVKRSKAAQ